MTVVAWFQVVVGVAILGLWTMLLATRQVPEISAGRRDIWFHITAEVAIAALLLVAGTWWLVGATSPARTLSAFALGGLLYTTINSPGHYAQERNRPAVAMFALLACLTVAAGLAVVAGS